MYVHLFNKKNQNKNINIFIETMTVPLINNQNDLISDLVKESLAIFY